MPTSKVISRCNGRCGSSWAFIRCHETRCAWLTPNNMSSVVPLRTFYADTPDLARVRRQQHLRSDYLLAGTVVIFSTLIFVFWNRAVIHWFVIPAMVCGVLIGVDVIRWLRGRLDFFDPKT